VVLFALAVLGLIAFALIETHRRVPMVDFSFFKSRTFAGANTVALIISFAMMAQFFFMALYMQNILGYSALQAGVRFLPSTLMIVIIAPIAGRLADRIGPKPLMLAGLTLLGLSLFLQSQISDTSGYGTLLRASSCSASASR
jgi:MFS family permease